jgi:GAF domain-containing protein
MTPLEGYSGVEGAGDSADELRCDRCLEIFETIGDALNSPMSTVEFLEMAARTIVEHFELKGCHFRLLSRDQRVLESVAAHGLSARFIDKGPIDAERSIAEALQGKVVLVEDCTSDSRVQYPLEATEEGIASILTVPLKTRGQVVGVVRLYTAEPRQFSHQELGMISVIASFCTSAIVHWMFHEILEHVTLAIRESLDLDDVLQSIVRVITEDLRAKGCTIRLLDSKSGRLEVRGAYGLSQPYVDRISGQPKSDAVAEALKGECVAILDARTDPRIALINETVQERISSMLYVPLMSRDTVIGVLCLYTNRPYEFSSAEVFMMRAIGEQAALAIRNAQMYATIKRRYDNVVDDFQQWFEHYHTYSMGR